jgi:type I restriction enzyme S subunit
LDRWIQTHTIFDSQNLPESWSIVRISDAVRQIEERVKVEKDKEYKLLGVRWYGEGTFLRETVLGSETSATFLYPVVPNALMYNRLFAWKKSFAIVPREHEGHFVSAEFPQFVVDENTILPQYLYLFFTLDATIEAVSRASVGSAAVSRNRFKEEDFLKFKLPLPPLDEQKRLVAAWQLAQNHKRLAAQNIVMLEEHTAVIALSDIGIAFAPLDKRPKAFVNRWASVSRWGVEFNQWDWNLDNLLLCQKYPTQLLSSVAIINPIIEKSLDAKDEVTFVPMAAVSDEHGTVETPQKRLYSEVKNGYTCFNDNDVIWAKITPCMENGKCAVVKNLVNGLGFGSTEFHVIRTKNDKVLMPEYIWVLLRLSHLRQAATRYFIGSAGQQRVPVDFLENLRIPIPPLGVQRDIVRRVEEGRRAIRQEREVAAKVAEETEREVERLILGLSKA